MSLHSDGQRRRPCLLFDTVRGQCQEEESVSCEDSVRRVCHLRGQCQKSLSFARAVLEGRVCQLRGQCQKEMTVTSEGNVIRKCVICEGSVTRFRQLRGQCPKEVSVNHRVMSEGRVCQPQGSVRRNVCQTQGTVRRKSLSTTTVVSGSSVQQCEVSTSAPCTFFSLFPPFFSLFFPPCLDLFNAELFPER